MLNLLVLFTMKPPHKRSDRNDKDARRILYDLDEDLDDLNEVQQEILRMKAEQLQKERDLLQKQLSQIKAPPLLVGTLVEKLDDQRAIVRASSGPSFVVSIEPSIDPRELIPGTRVGLHQRTLSIVDVLPFSKDPMVMAMELDERPQVTYNDIGGLKEQLRELREIVELPLTNPELFEQVGIDPPKGVLLHGPPGSGKTLMAKAVAHESNATFIRIIGSEFVQKYIGEGARLVREVFRLAREKAPSILFIDEIDAIGSRRVDLGTTSDREVQRTLMQLLSELDGFSPRGDVKIIAATNRKDILDPALMRPGRFDRHIEVPPPDLESRKEIFQIHTRKMNRASDVDIEELARMTEGATGADIKAICTEAGMFAIRERRTTVYRIDFIKATDKVLGRNRLIRDDDKKPVFT